MDKMVYVAMTGAKQTLMAQGVNSHNLANSSTRGFRADLHDFQALPVPGPGFATRVNAQVNPAGWSNSPGGSVSTGRRLDVAVNGDGWIAVQGPGGDEAYTRSGDLRIDALGQLRTGAGHPVLGDNGPIAIPPYQDLDIGRDGTISIVPLGQGAETRASIARIRLVNPPEELLTKSPDGLIRLADGSAAAPDASVTIDPGALEESNVNVVEAVVSMIELARRFETQIRVIDTANDNARAASRLMQIA